MILSVDHLQKYYGKRGIITKAIDNISFAMQEAEFTAIMGPSGSGKTTLLNCISTIDRPTAGHIYIDGYDITTLKNSQLASFRREHFGYIFQDYHLIETMTGFENIALALSVQRVPPDEILFRVHEVAQHLNIEDVIDKYPSKMSGGQKQRIAIARIFLRKPKILILDEVLSVGDGKFRKKSEKKILDMMQDGTAVLFVSHSLAQVKRICNKAMILEGGKMIAFGDVDEVAQVYAEMTGELDELTVGQKNLVKKKNKKKKTEKIKQEDKREVMEES